MELCSLGSETLPAPDFSLSPPPTTLVKSLLFQLFLLDCGYFLEGVVIII